MDGAESRRLWYRFLSGDSLPAHTQTDLVRALEADEALRLEVLEDARMDILLRDLAGDEVLTRRVLGRILPRSS